MGSDGGLGFLAQAALARRAVLAQLADLPARGGRHRAGSQLDLNEPPNSALAAELTELARATYQAPLLGHCLRCWYWADAFARLDDVRPDAELLYLACLLHDLGLADGHRPPSGAPCFALHGAEVARTMLVDRGTQSASAARVADAISAHLDPDVPLSRGPEAHLLQAAAHLDAAGTRARNLPPATVRAVHRRHPRDGFSTAFTALMRAESSARPRSRTGVLWRLGMPVLLTHNPLDGEAYR